MTINILGVDCEIDYDYDPGDASVGCDGGVCINEVIADCGPGGELDLTAWFNRLKPSYVADICEQLTEKHLDYREARKAEARETQRAMREDK